MHRSHEGAPSKLRLGGDFRSTIPIFSRANQIAPFKPGKGLDGFSCLLLRKPQFVEALEIQPKFRTRAEKMSEPQSSVARDGACPFQDLRDPIGRNVDLPCQLSRAHIELFQFFGQVFAGMDHINAREMLPHSYTSRRCAIRVTLTSFAPSSIK
jgi:hypothetical protein